MILKSVIHYPDTNSVEATWVDADDVQVKCHSYADVQMDMLEADLGDDAQAYAEMIAAVKAGIKPYVHPPLTTDAIVAAMDNLFNATAQAKRYDNRITCALRAGYAGPFQLEGIAFASWMDDRYALAHTLFAEVQSGTRPMPATADEALALLPPMVWPE